MFCFNQILWIFNWKTDIVEFRVKILMPIRINFRGQISGTFLFSCRKFIFLAKLNPKQSIRKFLMSSKISEIMPTINSNTQKLFGTRFLQYSCVLPKCSFLARSSYQGIRKIPNLLQNVKNNIKYTFQQSKLF